MNYIDLRILENNWYILLTQISYFYKEDDRIILINYFNSSFFLYKKNKKVILKIDLKPFIEKYGSKWNNSNTSTI